jgi:hypothetical protein
MGKAVHLLDANNVLFKECTFKHLGGDGIWIERQCDGCQFVANRFDDISRSGIVHSPIWETVERASLSTNNRIANNYMHGIGREYLEYVGIRTNVTIGTEIVHNTFENMPAYGLLVGDNSDWLNTEAINGSHNTFLKIGCFLTDVDAIYLGGRADLPYLDALFEYNHIKDVIRYEKRGIDIGVAFCYCIRLDHLEVQGAQGHEIIIRDNYAENHHGASTLINDAWINTYWHEPGVGVNPPRPQWDFYGSSDLEIEPGVYWGHWHLWGSTDSHVAYRESHHILNSNLINPHITTADPSYIVEDSGLEPEFQWIIGRE